MMCCSGGGGAAAPHSQCLAALSLGCCSGDALLLCCSGAALLLSRSGAALLLRRCCSAAALVDPVASASGASKDVFAYALLSLLLCLAVVLLLIAV